jgi:hypothetical protein
MNDNLFISPSYAPAKELIDERLNKVMRAEIKIGDGAGMSEAPDDWDPHQPPPNKTICIMEATAYILGHRITDRPPCTSEKIRSFMIEANDCGISNRKRAMLKQVIPDIVNTAPTVWKPISATRMYPEGKKLVTLQRDRRYRDAEKERARMIEDFDAKHGRNYGWSTSLAEGKLSMKIVLDFVRELAAVAKFDSENHAADVEAGAA